MRINRVKRVPLWWLLIWVVIAYWIIDMVCRACLEILIVAVRAAERYNRRRSIRKAYERDVAHRAAVRAQMAQAVIDGARWWKDGHPHNPWTGEPEDARPEFQRSDTGELNDRESR